MYIKILLFIPHNCRMNEINICITTTVDKYLKYTASLIQSLLDNLNPNFQYNIYILSNNKIHKKTQNKILWIKNNKINISYIYINENILKWYNNLKNKILLYKLILPDYINKDRILFMDCDTIITWDISRLYSIDLWNNIIAASKDCTLWDTPILKYYNVDKYFNAWIQVINLKKWREYEIWKKF